MAKSYSEFMASKPIEHFPSGSREDINRNLLSKILKRGKADDSAERMDRLKAMLAESKTGRQTLEFLEKKGSKMVFEPMDYYGYFSPDENLVALNPAMSDEDLAVTFVHEVRHAWQDSKMATTSPDMTPKSFLVSGFLIEADACASEVLYAHEMREKNPKIWEAHQKSCYAPMSTAFDKEFTKSGDVMKAREAALKTWYDLPVRKSYAETYVDYLSEVSREVTWKTSEKAFFEKRETKKMVDTLCKDYDGNQFFTDAKVLETPAKLYLEKNLARRLTKSLTPYMIKNKKQSKDLELDKIYVKQENGPTTTCAALMEAAAAKKKKLANFVKNAFSR